MAWGSSSAGLTLVHSDPITGGRTNRQTVTITFSRPVTGLAFTITDIDSSGGNWWDRIELSGARTATPASEVDGTGVFSDPWRFDDDDTDVWQHLQPRQRGRQLRGPGQHHHAGLLEHRRRRQPAHLPQRLHVHRALLTQSTPTGAAARGRRG